MAWTLSVCSLLLAAVHFSRAASPDQWKSRSIYQIVTDRFALGNGSITAPCDPGLGQYCGGNWQGVIQHLDYIEGMGFDALWISPVTLNLMQYTKNLGSYHGYWQQDLYKTNSAFGSQSDLKQLSDELHKRGMYLMVDIVVGDMAYAGTPDSVDYSVLKPFTDPKYYHQYCPIDPGTSNLTEVVDCWLGDTVVSLPDLRTEDPVVANMLYSWVGELISNYSIDGLRVDSVANLNRDFLPGLQNSAKSSYLLGEVFDGNVTSACSYQDSLSGMTNYPIFFPLTRAFQNTSGSMDDLVDVINQQPTICKDPTLLGTFSENHDVPRFGSYTKDITLASNILAFDILFSGIPIIYYGQEQHLNGSFNPVNREALWLTKFNTQAPLYNLSSTLNAFRKHAINTTISDYLGQSSVVWSDEHTLALSRGANRSNSLMVLNNNGNTSTYSLTIPKTGYQPGTIVTEILSNTNSTVDGSGSLGINIKGGMPLIYYPANLLPGAALYSKPGGSGNSSGNSTTKKGVATTSESRSLLSLLSATLILGSLGSLLV